MITIPHDHGRMSDNVRHRIPRDDDFARISEIFRVLGDPTRLKIFWLLTHGEECITNLAATLEMTQPAISHHIKQLKNADLIVGRRDGKEVLYKAVHNMQVKHLHDSIEALIDMECPDWVQ